METITQVYKGQQLTRTVVKNNILRIWKMSSEEDRHDWYKDALAYASYVALYIDGKKAINKACGVIAALSPVKTWSHNKTCALDLVTTGDCGHMKQFKQKAKDILASDGTDETILSILNGNKISAFFLNIRYPDVANVITIDRHALSIALGRWITEEDYRGMTTKQYNFFVHCYVIAATQVGVTPLLMQSATWVKWRQIKSEYR